MALPNILLAALGIGLLIFVHELGHFLAARAAGVRVEVFSLGFGSRLWGFEWRGTDFRLSLVPFGGYVMVAGQDPNDHRYPPEESLHSKSAGQRALFWSGGVLMNVLVALVLFPIVFLAGVDFPAPVAGQVPFGSAAWEVGMKPNERVVRVGAKAVYSFDNMMIEVALAGGRPLSIVVAGSDGGERELVVRPQYDPGRGIFGLGIRPAALDRPARIEVAAGSAAATAGVQTGDLLLAVNGKPCVGAGRSEAMQPLLELTGAPLQLQVERDGKPVDLVVTPIAAATPPKPRVGIQLLPRVVQAMARAAELPKRLDLRHGDVLLGADGQPFLSGDLRTLADVAAPEAGGPAQLVLLVRRSGAVVELSAPATVAERRALAEQVALATDETLRLWPLAGQPAAAAGVQPGDRVLAIDGAGMRDFEQLRKAIQATDKQPRRLQVSRLQPGPIDSWLDRERAELKAGATIDLTVMPAPPPEFESGLEAILEERSDRVVADGFGHALAMGSRLSLDLVKQLYLTVKRMVTGEVSAKNLGGLVRISQVSYQAAKRGWTWFLYLMGMLSVNLAFVNLLPIPVLDGGHLLFVLIEKVKGSPVNPRITGYSQVVGLVFVLMLVLFVTYNDIMSLF